MMMSGTIHWNWIFPFDFDPFPTTLSRYWLDRTRYLKPLQSEKIGVGDIVRVRRDEQFPADLVLVSASNNTGKCFVMTANLDGETNLKPLFASKETKGRFTLFQWIQFFIPTEAFLGYS